MEQSFRPHQMAGGGQLGRSVMGFGGLTIGVLGGVAVGAGADIPGPLGSIVACLAGLTLVALAMRPAAVADVPVDGNVVTDLAGEIDRARRHRRPLAVVRLDVSVDGDVNEVQRRLGPQLRSADRLRRVDDALVAVLPDTDRAGVDHLLERVVAEHGPLARTAAVVFPEDGLTVGALLSRLQEPRVPASLPAMVIDRSVNAEPVAPTSRTG